MIPSTPRIIKPIRFNDVRGYFSETYNLEDCRLEGINDVFVQDNTSYSIYPGTLRGLHFQAPPFAQSKLVRCVRGSIFDVVVDIRKGSQNYAKWESYNLTAEAGEILYVPIGFAHGFLTLEPDCEVSYKCSNYYEPAAEGALRWDTCGIDWPFFEELILSEKDKVASALEDLNTPFIYGVNS